MLSDTGCHLSTKRSRSIDCVRRTQGRGIRSNDTKNAVLVEEMVDEIHRRRRVSCAPVYVAVKRSIRHIIGCLPDVGKLCKILRMNRVSYYTLTINNVRDSSSVGTMIHKGEQTCAIVN